MSDGRKRYPVGTRVRKCEVFDGRQWVDGVVMVEPDGADDGFYTVEYEDGDVEEYNCGELDRLVQWKSLQVGRRIKVRLPADREKAWKTGVIVKFRPQKKKAFQVRFDKLDTDRDHNMLLWLSFLTFKFEILPESSDKSPGADSKSPLFAEFRRQPRQSISGGDHLETQGAEDDRSSFCLDNFSKSKEEQFFIDRVKNEKACTPLYHGRSFASDSGSQYPNNQEAKLSISKKRRVRDSEVYSTSENDKNNMEGLAIPEAAVTRMMIADESKTAKSKAPVTAGDSQPKRPSIKVGDRLEIHDDENNLYYPGTVTKFRKRLCFFKCDDGDKGWVDLSQTKYRHFASRRGNESVDRNLDNQQVELTKSAKRRRSEMVNSVNSAAVFCENDTKPLVIPVAEGKQPANRESKAKGKTTPPAAATTTPTALTQPIMGDLTVVDKASQASSDGGQPKSNILTYGSDVVSRSKYAEINHRRSMYAPDRRFVHPQVKQAKNSDQEQPSSQRGGNSAGASNRLRPNRIPPPPGAPQSKKVNGQAYHWCSRCRLWCLRHGQPSAPEGMGHGGFRPQAYFAGVADPSPWLACDEQPLYPFSLLMGVWGFILCALFISVTRTLSLFSSAFSVILAVLQSSKWSVVGFATVCISGLHRSCVVGLVGGRDNLSWTTGYNYSDTTAPPSRLHATISKLTETEKELLRFHTRLGHLNFRKVALMMRSGALAGSETGRRIHIAAAKSTRVPKCAARLFGKHTQRPSKATNHRRVRDREEVLRKNDQLPGWVESF